MLNPLFLFFLTGIFALVINMVALVMAARAGVWFLVPVHVIMIGIVLGAMRRP